MTNDKESVSSVSSSNSSEPGKVRGMTLKGFLQKAGKPNISARAFLGSNEAWIATQPGGIDAISIIKEVHAIVLPATEGLHKVIKILSEAELAAKILEVKEKAEKKIAKEAKKVVTSSESVEESESELYHTARIVDEHGKVIMDRNSKGELVELVKSYKLPQEAKRWACRRMEEIPGTTAELTDSRHPRILEVVSRNEATNYLRAHTKNPILAKTGVGPGSQKCQQSRSHFSHG